MAVHFSPWLLLLVSTAFMASYMLTSAADEDTDDVLALAAKTLQKYCSKACKKSSKAFCKPPQCGRPGVDSCRRCKRNQKKNCVKVLCGKGKVTEGNYGNPGSCENPGSVSLTSRSETTYTIGSTVNYTCNAGYEMTAGDTTLTCSNKKTWIGTKPTCSNGSSGNPGSCRHPGDVSFTLLSGTDYTYGSMVNYTCVTGYEMTAGVTTLTCSKKKTWIGSKPTCSIVSCGDPGNVNFSIRSGITYTYQAKVTYTCITGYERMAGDTTLTCGSNKAWIGSKPTCSKVSCGNPGNASAASQSGTTYTFGARVTYICKTGYEVSTLTCGSNRTWIGAKPNCSTTYNIGKKTYDCADLYMKGVRLSGVYQIHFSTEANTNQGVFVYCDMTTDGGGWTVFQRRFDGSVDFFRNWENYANGFGSTDGEYWLGLDAIHPLTADRPSELRVDLQMMWERGNKYAKYANFSVGDSASKYTLKVGTYSGDAGDALSYHNNRPFTTKDRDNDIYYINCANRTSTHGAWWYGGCLTSSLNGRYSGIDSAKVYWGSRNYKTSEMKFRPSGFTSG